MKPPPGEIADLEHPRDVLRTVNLVTQALTLFACTMFVFIRGYHKFRIVRLSLASDDCETWQFSLSAHEN
jgi:hypothetical protein